MMENMINTIKENKIVVAAVTAVAAAGAGYVGYKAYKKRKAEKAEASKKISIDYDNVVDAEIVEEHVGNPA